MKAKKVLRRLAKIDALISEVTDRCSKSAVQIQKALQGAKAAFGRVKKAVNVQASSEKAKRHVAAAKRKKGPLKTAAIKRPTAKIAKKSAPIKKTVRKAVAKRATLTPVDVPVQEPTGHVA